MMRSDGEEAEGSLPRCRDGGGAAARDAGTPMPGKQCGLTVVSSVVLYDILTCWRLEMA